LTRDELYKHFCSSKKARKKVVQEGGFTYNWMRLLSPEQRAEFEEEAVSIWAEDALQYHDINRDGAISLDELTHSLLQWSVVRYRSALVRSTKKAKSPKKWLQSLLDSEREVLREYFCEDPAACPAADELSTYGEVLLQGNKKALTSKMRKVMGMFEHVEGDDETLTFMDRQTGSQNQMKVGQVKSQEL